MAEGEDGPRWPGPVTFNDDEPKKGFASIYLSVPKLQAKRRHGIIGKQRAANAEVESNFEQGSIQVMVKVCDNGQEMTFEYKKNAPAEIDPLRCELLYKEKYVIVKLAKVKTESWTRHSRYLIERPG